jgi:putative phosphoribosyl transferase
MATIQVAAGGVRLHGELTVPNNAVGIVLFAHGSGSSRFSSRNQFVARALEQRGLATLLIDLLTPDEEALDQRTAHIRFDIPLLARRLVAIVDWLKTHPPTAPLKIGLFGASTGGGAALMAAAARPNQIGAVVSRGGRPDLAGEALGHVMAPTLLIVGGADTAVISMNREAMRRMRGTVSFEIVPGATHLFEEAGALQRVAQLAAHWFTVHLSSTSAAA